MKAQFEGFSAGVMIEGDDETTSVYHGIGLRDHRGARDIGNCNIIVIAYGPDKDVNQRWLHNIMTDLSARHAGHEVRSVALTETKKVMDESTVEGGA